MKNALAGRGETSPSTVTALTPGRPASDAAMTGSRTSSRDERGSARSPVSGPSSPRGLIHSAEETDKRSDIKIRAERTASPAPFVTTLMSFKQHVEAHTTAAFRALIVRTSEQARQELDTVCATLQGHSEALAARFESPLEPADSERLITLVNDLARAAEEEALVAARGARAEAFDALQSQMRAVQAQAQAKIEAARAAHQSDLEAAAAAKAALAEALGEARKEADRVRAEADTLKGRQAQVEVALADLRAQLEAERSATASLSNALAEVRNEADRATAKAAAARCDTRTRVLQAITPVTVVKDDVRAGRSAAAEPPPPAGLPENDRRAELDHPEDDLAAATHHRSRRTVPPEEHTGIDPPPPPETAPATNDLPDACLAIDTANSLKEVLNAFLDHLAVRFSRAALFLVKGDRVQSWRVVGFQGPSADLRNFEVPVTANSLLTNAVRIGRLVVTSDDLDSNGSCSGEGVPTAVALPIRIADSVVAVAYADGGQPSGHEPQRTIPTSTLRDAETLVEHAVRRLTTLLATSGVIASFKAVPSAAPGDSHKVVSFPQPGRSDDTRTTVISTGPEAAPRQAEEPREVRRVAQVGLALPPIQLTTDDRLGDSSGTGGRGETSLGYGIAGSQVTPVVPPTLSLDEDTRRESAVHNILSLRRIALVAPLLVTVVAIASQVWVSEVGAGRRHAPSDGPQRERAPLQRVADGAPDAAVLPPGVRELRGQALTMRVTAHRECWIRVTADGQMVREGLMRGDEEMAVEAREAILLKIGDAGALSVVVNGRTARSLGGDGQVVALQITRANYQDLIAQQPPRASSTSSSARIPQKVPIPDSGALETDTPIEGLSEPASGG